MPPGTVSVWTRRVLRQFATASWTARQSSGNGTTPHSGLGSFGPWWREHVVAGLGTQPTGAELETAMPPTTPYTVMV